MRAESFFVFLHQNMEKAKILIADSGSTKTDWVVVERGADGWLSHEHWQTQGLNPVLMSDGDMSGVLHDELLPQVPGLKEEVREVFFYGAGVRPDMVQRMEQVLAGVFRAADAHAASDLLGAARALCGHGEGIACILGTGANSCLFDGEQIVANTPALGFILGDEGGGAALGKRFLNAIFKGLLPARLRDEYLQATGLTLADIIRRVYREPMPNRFLASTSTFVAKHVEEEQVRLLVVENFRQFFTHNIVAYGRRDLPVSFVGSIAHYYEPLLRQAAEAEGFEVGKIVKSPIDALCDYHQDSWR